MTRAWPLAQDERQPHLAGAAVTHHHAGRRPASGAMLRMALPRDHRITSADSPRSITARAAREIESPQEQHKHTHRTG
jgi:hypothetical protein